MFTVLVAGAGYLGGAIAKHFAEKKQKVFAIVRTGRNLPELEKNGVCPIIADLENGETLQKKIPPAHFVIFSAAPAERTLEGYQKSYGRGLANLIKTIQGGLTPRFFIYFSSTGVWGNSVEGPVDDSRIPDLREDRQKILFDAEEQVLSSGLPASVIRLGGIYGPGRNRLSAFCDGRWPEPGTDRYVNLIHRDDVVQSMQILLNKARTGERYTLVDNEPSPKSLIYHWLCERFKTPVRNDLFTGPPKGKVCSNKKIKALGGSFRFPTFRTGYESLIEDECGHLPL